MHTYQIRNGVNQERLNIRKKNTDQGGNNDKHNSKLGAISIRCGVFTDHYVQGKLITDMFSQKNEIKIIFERVS